MIYFLYVILVGMILWLAVVVLSKKKTNQTTWIYDYGPRCRTCGRALVGRDCPACNDWEMT